jgi:hypothetical protein
MNNIGTKMTEQTFLHTSKISILVTGNKRGSLMYSTPFPFMGYQLNLQASASISNEHNKRIMYNQ